MDHCHIRFYLMGRRRDIFEPVKGMSLPEGFTCDFLESGEPEKELARQADVILACLQGMDEEKILSDLFSYKETETRLILAVSRGQVAFTEDFLSEIEDVWTVAMSKEELIFRFRKWMKDYRTSRQVEYFSDFTAEKKQKEKEWEKKNQELRYHEQMHRIFSTFLSEKIDDVYMMLDAREYEPEYVSANAERVLGISWEKIKADLKQLGRASYVEGEEIGYEELSRMEPGKAPKVVETERIDQKTGEHKWFRESIYCVLVQNEKKIVVYISDRTREKTNQNALSEALNMAQVANKAKSRFLSNVSHDIRTPLNAIMGFTSLLQEEADNPERVMEYTQKISGASQHLLGLINDVLDMNRIESGSTMINVSEMNMAEIIDGLNTIIRPQARAKAQTFEIYTSLTYEHLLGDKLRVNQILINILSNAVKYTPDGGTIKLAVRELPQVDRSYSRIRFTVSDNGQGMSEDYLKVIFDPFTREQRTTVNKIQGTGLGMAITKNLVDLMNGSIMVESRPGQGSTFTVELELRIQERTDDPDFWKKHGIFRMIVADDDDSVCRDIVKKMMGTNVAVRFATNGRLAVEMIRRAREQGEPYDLIILDWKMPDLDGLETACLIRKNYPEKTPILFFTAYDWADIEEEAMEIGNHHFLQKPFFMSSFKEAIQRMMGVRKEPVFTDKERIVENKRILVVDDIDVNRMILVKILETLGAVCDVAENGQQAVEKFLDAESGNYEIILMDVQMPVMNGYEATKAIRGSGHPSAGSVPIIAMTANAFVDDIRDALEAGMDAHVSKPVVLDQLKHTIQEVLERGGHYNYLSSRP